MEERSTYVGLDVHKKMINVALLRPGTRDPVTWDVPNEPEAVRRSIEEHVNPLERAHRGGNSHESTSLKSNHGVTIAAEREELAGEDGRGTQRRWA